ncbi:MAG TPA: phenylalanine--tRNA ligase subunit beta, partial [Fimbriimonadaceae bacterium]|nr:phenylalanine--tRNA ligase subunit beta [Fimbriimonadaceae bacterium]
EFEGVKNGPSPDWIQKRLRQAGMRPISMIVDLTNYVMLEVGQPMHAFDQSTLSGEKIIVRQAKPGEKLTTLNGVEHNLNARQVMICDAERAIAAAGVMGGAETEVSESTTRVLLESAHFLNTSVRRTRKELGLSTEASYRFERSVDPAFVVAAMNRFADLLGLAPVALTDVWPVKPEAKTVQLRMSRAVKLLGMPIETDAARGYLERLGMRVEGDGEPFRVGIPTWRFDLIREDDLVEELGRVHGYDKIPEDFPRGVTTLGGVWGVEDGVDRVRNALVRAGMIQVMNHSLRGASPLDAVGERVGPRNILDPDLCLLRNSLLPGIAESALRNRSERITLFEHGKVFSASEEHSAVGFVIYGPAEPSSIGRTSSRFDFFDGKRLVGEVAAAIGLGLDVGQSGDARLHPTRQASVWNGAGVFGQIHPDLAESLGLPADTVLGEINLDKVLDGKERSPKLIPLSKNPAVRRDIAILIEKSVPYATVEATVREAAGAELEKSWLFDVYDGKTIPVGHHSLAIALQLRKHGANFTDEEANQVRDGVVAALERLGATLR